VIAKFDKKIDITKHNAAFCAFLTLDGVKYCGVRD
jgi:hypothetical protein